ncbi:epithelial cell-transforming sequence 2 oncogene-like isoform X2 [Poecilia latipinna]|uniref:epithelial cell-transforming sequence 2 oncogene-like isoform X2 n=1 Tax=Poecilia latipinna TaxID=48699 RepID=UPI00072EC34E|nr:PREDICTED: epithelial cell-transforming sequence 2 oncogene-like isoform X2 [Poecilia latipinna]
MWNLSDLTGLEVRAPLGFATGSFQNILSEWSGGDQDPAAPALCYVTDSVLLGWCRQAQWIEEVLVCLRKSLELQLQQASLQARCRALGLFLWENISLDTLGVCGELSEALTEGLTALNRQNESRPVEFLSSFLMKWSKEDGEMSQGGGSSCPDNFRLEMFSWKRAAPQRAPLSGKNEGCAEGRTPGNFNNKHNKQCFSSESRS